MRLRILPVCMVRIKIESVHVLRAQARPCVCVHTCMSACNYVFITNILHDFLSSIFVTALASTKEKMTPLSLATYNSTQTRFRF